MAFSIILDLATLGPLAWHAFGLSPIAKVVRFYYYSTVYQSVCPLACKVGVALGRQERYRSVCACECVLCVRVCERERERHKEEDGN